MATITTPAAVKMSLQAKSINTTNKYYNLRKSQGKENI